MTHCTDSSLYLWIVSHVFCLATLFLFGKGLNYATNYLFQKYSAVTEEEKHYTLSLFRLLSAVFLHESYRICNEIEVSLLRVDFVIGRGGELLCLYCIKVYHIL